MGSSPNVRLEEGIRPKTTPCPQDHCTRRTWRDCRWFGIARKVDSEEFDTTALALAKYLCFAAFAKLIQAFSKHILVHTSP